MTRPQVLAGVILGGLTLGALALSARIECSSQTGAPSAFPRAVRIRADSSRGPAAHAVPRVSGRDAAPPVVEAPARAGAAPIPDAQATAERRAHHAPVPVAEGVRLESGALSATIDGSVHVQVGTRAVRLRARSLTRGGRGSTFGDGDAMIRGRDVHVARADGIEEWWRALPRGLEQGFTVDDRLPGDGPIRVAIDVGGDVRPVLEGDAIAWRDAHGRAVARYGELSALDADGTPLTAHLAVEDDAMILEVDDDGARYPIVIDPLVTVAQADFYTNSSAGDARGRAVTADFSARNFVAGAPLDDTAAGADAGSVDNYFVGGNSATLFAPDGAPGDQFGSSVSTDSLGRRMAIGAPYDDTPAGVDTGSAWIFRWSINWFDEQQLLPTDAQPGDRIGAAVAISVDAVHVVVGAPMDDTPAGVDAGSARVFVRIGTTWTEEATLLAPGGGAGDRCGTSVAIDYTGTRILVGSPGRDTVAGADAGSVDVFVRSGTTWSHEATLTHAGAAAGDAFGTDVGTTDDGGAAVVGAPLADVVGVDSGDARVFYRAGSVWTERATLRPADMAAGDQVGAAVAIDGPAGRILLGVPFDDFSTFTDAGSTRLYVWDGSAWVEDSELRHQSPSSDDHFGADVALSADSAVAVVGAPDDTVTSQAGAGSATRFDLSTSGALGATCASGNTCNSGYCVDGVCCDSACGGGVADCQRCTSTVTGEADGVCRMTPATVVCRPSAGACDAAERCTGTTGTCPADRPMPTDTICRPALAPCDAAETCDGVTTTCPADQPASASTTCRPAVGPCDVAETCDGTATTCPPDAYSGATVECRPATSICDVAELCTGSSTTCPADGFKASTEPCGGAASPCRGPGFCAGTSATCLAATLPDGTSCDDGSPCSSDERCVAGACVGLPANAGTPCRTARGVCDVAETCDGVSSTCPGDRFVNPGTWCRPGLSACDNTETCDGLSPDCPTDTWAGAGTECRKAAGPCDVAEACTGLSPACPADGFAAATQPCGDPPDDCNDPGFCSGVAADCPAAYRPDGTACDDASPCSTGETCSAGRCVGGTPAAATMVCRPARGPCDAVERCDGSTTVCPDDELLAGTECRPSAGGCDLAEFCSGLSAKCPAGDVRFPPGFPCRGMVGVCDVPEVCDGVSATCPADGYQTPGVVCYPGGNVCDPPDVCGGTAASCPPLVRAEGDPCDDGLACTQTSQCTSGTCQPGLSLDCSDSNPCTTDGCLEPTGCFHSAVPACIDDAGAGTDASSSPDAGMVAPANGCSCRVASLPASSPRGGAWLVAVALAAVARRRAARRR